MDAARARFTDIYATHYRDVLAFVLRRTGCTATAQDLTEDVFVVAWRKIDEVPVGDEAAYWLFGVARKVLAAHHRTTGTRRRIMAYWRPRSPQPDPLPEDVVVRREGDRLVDEALGRLRDRDRELIRMAYWDELPHAAIAQILGVERGTVDVRLHRAIRRLGKELDRSGHVGGEGLAARAPKESEC